MSLSPLPYLNWTLTKTTDSLLPTNRCTLFSSGTRLSNDINFDFRWLLVENLFRFLKFELYFITVCTTNKYLCKYVHGNIKITCKSMQIFMRWYISLLLNMQIFSYNLLCKCLHLNFTPNILPKRFDTAGKNTCFTIYHREINNNKRSKRNIVSTSEA